MGYGVRFFSGDWVLCLGISTCRRRSGSGVRLIFVFMSWESFGKCFTLFEF